MILITGGMGFIGIWTARALAGHEHIVLGYNRSVRGEEEPRSLIGVKVDTVRLDVTSPYSVARALARFQPTGPFAEDRPLPVNSPNATSAMKKAAEVLALHHADRTGLDLRVRGTLPGARSHDWTPQELLPGRTSSVSRTVPARSLPSSWPTRRATVCTTLAAVPRRTPLRHPVRRPSVRRLAARTRTLTSRGSRLRARLAHGP